MGSSDLERPAVVQAPSTSRVWISVMLTILVGLYGAANQHEIKGEIFGWMYDWKNSSESSMREADEAGWRPVPASYDYVEDSSRHVMILMRRPMGW